jgi:hypothetical protein
VAVFDRKLKSCWLWADWWLIRIQERLNALRKSIELDGPVQASMPHFGKLTGWTKETYHCHLNKGRPTYVAVWQVKKRTVCLVEVIYAGTHEKAPY